MTEEHVTQGESQESQDSKADMRAAIVVFCAAVAMAIHFVAGFTFDF